jgi:hypothetical protein
MKRTSVEVSDTLLQEARKVMKQDEPVRVVEHALSELVRIAELKRGIQTLKDTNDVFWPHYLEEIRPNSWSAYEKRRAVYEGREPDESKYGRRPD